MFIDTAQTAKKTNDPSAIVVMGIVNNIIYVKKANEYWLEFPDLLKKIKEVANSEANPNTVKIYIEPKSSGHGIIQSLRNETMLNVIQLESPRDPKIKRVQAITPVLQSGRVKLLKGSWNEDFILQCTMFPNGRHDDLLDSLVYGVDQLFNRQKKIVWYM